MSTPPAGAPVALVTGANKGIGLETARRLVEAGYRVYLGARNPELGKPAADRVGAQFLEVDVTSQESVDPRRRDRRAGRRPPRRAGQQRRRHRSDSRGQGLHAG